jgi:general secretion pathway protein K
MKEKSDRSQMKPSHMNEKGIALVLILWVLALLSVIAGEFSYAMRTEVNITRNFMAQTQAYYVALAGVNRAIGELIRNDVISKPSSLSDDRARRERGRGKAEEDEPVEDEDRWRINVDMAPVSFGAGEFRVRIDNESGKININGANEQLLKMMMDAFDMEDEEKSIIVDSILDWRDKDDLHRAHGAENDYYNALPEPYDCKNDAFDSVEELLLVRGITQELYDGGLKQMVSVVRPPKNNEKTIAGFKQFRVDFNKVNLNAAPREILQALPSMTEGLAMEMMAYRDTADFRVMSEVCSIVGGDVCNAIGPYATLELGPYYRVKAEGVLASDRIRRGVEVVVEIDRRLKKGYRVIEWRDQSRITSLSTPAE